MSEMTAPKLAEQLEGTTYPVKVPNFLAAKAKAAGLVIVYGASDDLMEFEGAISDEIDAYGGATAYLTPSGLLNNGCDNDDCPHFAERKKQAAKVQALWACEGGYSWTFHTEIPHATFEVTEDGEPYCRGIVFRLADAKEAAQ